MKLLLLTSLLLTGCYTVHHLPEPPRTQEVLTIHRRHRPRQRVCLGGVHHDHGRRANNHNANTMILLKCGRRPCSHVLWEDEQDGQRIDSVTTRRICPRCGCDSFWTLNERGQISSWRTQRDIDPKDISPSPRMGPKMKSQLLAAQKRALK